jgi:hypothetical protein
MLLRASLTLLALLLGGCAVQPPHPWQKAQLALPQMTMDRDPLAQRFDQRTREARQAASGGYGVGGGGCGCN